MKWLEKFYPWRYVWDVIFYWCDKGEREFKYTHFWYDIQMHVLKLWLFQVEWKGWPWLTKFDYEKKEDKES